MRERMQKPRMDTDEHEFVSIRVHSWFEDTRLNHLLDPRGSPVSSPLNLSLSRNLNPRPPSASPSRDGSRDALGRLFNPGRMCGCEPPACAPIQLSREKFSFHVSDPYFSDLNHANCEPVRRQSPKNGVRNMA